MSAPERPMELRAELERLRAENAKLRQDVGTLEVRGWQQRSTPAERALIEHAVAERRFRLRDDWADIVGTSEGVRRYGRFIRLTHEAADAVLAERKERDSE